MRFQELFEMPQAMIGDLNWDEVELRYADTAFSKFWTVVGQLQTALGNLDIARGQNSWIIGEMHARDDIPDHREFRAVLRADGELPNRAVPYHNPIIIRFVYVARDERLTGLATAFYRWLVQNGYTPIGDYEQYDGARKLWARLSAMPGYAVDLLNIYTGQIIKSGPLHQGNDPSDFDKQAWSLDERLVNIRPVLRKASQG